MGAIPMMVYHKWKPIQPIEQESEQYDFAEIKSLQQQWLTIRKEYESSTPQRYQAFMERLGRSWAIETGIIEGLYTLDRGVTETLVRDGIVADYIEHSSTNRDPSDLVRTLNDHQEAIDFVYHYIRDGNPLTLSFIRQLHQIFARHQDTYEAVDQFGNIIHPILDRGGFKQLPNNPTRADGSVHEYCPPVQVESELESLLYFYNECQKEGGVYHPLLTGAWLHHRFTQIHPFQDGNGRVARALLTWHLVREGYLPVVIYRDSEDSRNTRKDYISALEKADQGNLLPFIDLLVELEKNTILQALGEPEPVAQPELFDQVLDHIVEQIKRQSQDRESQMRSVNDIAEKLRDAVKSYLSDRGTAMTGRLHEAGMSLVPALDAGGPGDKEHWYRAEVIATANHVRQWVNLNESRFFVKLSLNAQESRLPRLVFVVSLHHTGRQLTGIMAATAFAQIEYYPDDNADRPGEFEGPYFRNCTVNPFTFTWDSDADAIIPRFTKWAEEGLTIALRYWSEFLR
jgi:Fic family protein